MNKDATCNKVIELCARRHYALAVGETAERTLEDILREAGSPGRLEEQLSGFKQRVLEELFSLREAELNICRSLERVEGIYYRPLVDGLRRLGLGFFDARYRAGSKLLVGASGGVFAAVFEVGLAWDMLFDLPYIPGSSLKGLVRSWSLRGCAELDGVENRRKCAGLVFQLFGATVGWAARDEEAQWFADVFGEVPFVGREEGGWAGLVAFYDAYPVERGTGRLGCGLLEPDVVTPHYYRGGEAVKDELSAEPVPVPHLVVAPGTVFRIVVSLDPGGEDVARALAGMLRGSGFSDGVSALAWIINNALGEGVGARTGKGYGEVKDEDKPSLQPIALSIHRRSGAVGWRNKRW